MSEVQLTPEKELIRQEWRDKVSGYINLKAGHLATLLTVEASFTDDIIS